MKAKWLFGIMGVAFAMSGSASAQQRDLPQGTDRDFVSRACQACHDLSMVIAATGLNREGWDATIEEMVSYGLRVSPEERVKLLDYLSTYLGPPR